MGTQLRRYKPETITRALLNLRAQIVRECGDGLEHVEALLQLRGYNLGPVPRKAVTPARFRRNRLRVAIYIVLRAGPLTGPEIVRQIAEAHGIAYDALYRSVYAQLYAMKRAGRLAHEGRLFGVPLLLCQIKLRRFRCCVTKFRKRYTRNPLNKIESQLKPTILYIS